jgi:hypothetical protein
MPSRIPVRRVALTCLLASSFATTPALAADPLVEKSAGKPAVASSVESSIYAASKGNDGNTSTRWSSSFTDNQWWRVDLGSARLVSEVRVNWEVAHATSYRIQTSTDGVTFTDAAQVTASAPGLKTTTFTPRSARYVRLLGVKRAYSTWGISFYELQVFGPAEATTPTAPATPAVPLKLVNASTGAGLSALTEGQKLDLAILPATLDVVAEPAGSAHKSVKFCLDGTCRTESSAPYTLDDTSDAAALSLKAGAHTLTVTAYDQAAGAGKAIATSTVKFSVAAPAQPTRPTATPAPSGTVKWQSAFASNPIGHVVPGNEVYGKNLAGWEDTPWNMVGGGTVSVVSDGRGGKAMRSFGPANQGRDGSQRAEQVPAYYPGNNDMVWMGFDLWVNADLGVSNTWQGVLQGQNSAQGSPNWSLGINQFGHEGLDIGGHYKEHSLAYLGATPYGKWTRIVIGEQLSGSAGAGSIEVWRDGVKVLAKTPWTSRQYDNFGGSLGSTLFPGTSRFYKFGVYRGPQAFNADFRVANLKMGTTKDIVS